MVAPDNTARRGPPFLRKGSVPVTLSLADESVTVVVADPTVTASSVIIPAAMAGDGMDGDELEMDPIIVAVGAIVPGVSFELIAAPAPHSSPDGTYKIGFHAW